METVVKLGRVTNGNVPVREVSLEKFTILITAEVSADVRAPSKRLILRGQSPSTRLFPPDLMEFSLGAMKQSSPMEHDHGMSGDWPMVPVPPGLTMLPAEMALRPEVTPFLPVPDDAAPLARPREVLHLKDSDTLRLEAGLVRRTLNGRTYTMYGYNGQYPGPLLDVQRGSEVTVQFVDELPESSSVHWHGIRLDNAFDGVAAVDREFTYRVRFPDAGIYWYHPHQREDIQQELGLYGNILVRDSAETLEPVDREEVLLLDDLLVADDGALIPLGKESPTHALMGRFGNLFLVNGEPDYRLSVRRGDVIRFYLTNASNARTMNLSFTGARMKVVAAEAGPLEHDAWVESVVIAPAERYVVDVQFTRPRNAALVNRVLGLDHLFGRFFHELDTLGVVTVGADRTSRDFGRVFAALRRHSPPLAAASSYLNRPPDKTLTLTLQAHGLPYFTERLMQLDSMYFAPVEWGGTMPMMNWAATGEQVHWMLADAETGKRNMDIDWHFARGKPAKIRLVNERRAFHGMQHPIHLHGQRFLVLAVNGVPNDDLGWKDTVLVPAGAVVDILLDTSNPGDWMLHCHIAEHLAAGMMMHFTVN
jgi:FtsP/CotA-like multicopper oxidase with cupredoxin domain